MQQPDHTLLSAQALFGDLPSERLTAQLTKRSFLRGSTIIRKGDVGTEMFVVVSGTVKISAPGVDGREAIFNQIGEGQVFGEVAMFDGNTRTADAVAASDCEVMIINRREYSELAQKDSTINFKLIEVLCSRIRKTSEQLEDVLLLDLRTRLAKTLLRLATDAGGRWPRRLLVTQREVSHRIGVSREGTNKQLRLWAQAGWIRLERSCIVVLQPNALAKIARNR